MLTDVSTKRAELSSKVVSTEMDGNDAKDVVEEASPSVVKERVLLGKAVKDGWATPATGTEELVGPSPWNVTDLGVPAYELRLAVRGVLDPLSCPDPMDERSFVLDACEALLE